MPLPPRAVATPRAFNALGMSVRVVAPAFCASLMMGRTLAANLSAEAVTVSIALLRATWSLGLPPRVLLQPRGPAGSVCGDKGPLLLGQRGEQVEHERINTVEIT